MLDILERREFMFKRIRASLFALAIIIFLAAPYSDLSAAQYDGQDYLSCCAAAEDEGYQSIAPMFNCTRCGWCTCATQIFGVGFCACHASSPMFCTACPRGHCVCSPWNTCRSNCT